MGGVGSEAVGCLCRSPSRQQFLLVVVGLQAVEHRALQALALLALHLASRRSTQRQNKS